MYKGRQSQNETVRQQDGHHHLPASLQSNFPFIKAEYVSGILGIQDTEPETVKIRCLAVAKVLSWHDVTTLYYIRLKRLDTPIILISNDSTIMQLNN